MNALALHGLRLDVMGLESFADECGVTSLRVVFRPLRQLLDALLDRGAAAVLGDPDARTQLYPTLDPGDAARVLGKVVGIPVVARMKSRGGGELPSLDRKHAAELMRLLQGT